MFPEAPPVIAFLSDYGVTDAFVGICHGVIASACPAAKVIDLTHGVRRQDVRQGARFSVTSTESSFHTDNSFGTTLLDYVGLLCLNAARVGGSTSASSRPAAAVP